MSENMSGVESLKKWRVWCSDTEEGMGDRVSERVAVGESIREMGSEVLRYRGGGKAIQ